MYSRLFQEAYLNSLANNYSLFYDDFHEYGNRSTAKHAIYFVPGLNGTPGQVRLAMPAIKRVFDTQPYIKCLYLEEFSARVPVWEKYTVQNVEKKALKIIADVKDLLNDFENLIIFASSAGFYDFANAFHKELHQYRDKIKLFWVACSPQQIEYSSWHAFFRKINGFEKNGFEWAAFPNIDVMKFIHKESDTKFKWKADHQRRSLYKIDLESRFRCLKLLWFYASIDCFNTCLAHATRDLRFPLDLSCYILAADKDGYWSRMPLEKMKAALNYYVKDPRILFKRASHLWVAVPNNLNALMRMAIEANDISL